MTTAAADTAHATEIGAHAEAAMRAVRVMVAILACVVLGAYRPLAEGPQWWSLGGVLVAIIAVTTLLNVASSHVGRRRRWAAALQTADVAAAVALAVSLDGPLGHQSWMLLIIPIVNAAVRWGAAAVVLSWLGAGVGYVAAVYLDLAVPGDDATAIVRVSGTLLAVALAVGLLARWMREGWELQNELTSKAATREQRMATIEATIPTLRGLSTDEALEVCAGQALALGFGAATIDWPDGSSEPIVVGDTTIVADRADAPKPTAAEPVVTVWTEGREVRAHSVAALESQTKTLVTAWSRLPVDEDRALALVTLVGHTSAAIETSSLLHRLRESAEHDPLTGLANRRSLDRQLREHAQSGGCLSVAFIDLDDFKAINDQFGHEIGDKVLVALGERLKSVAGPYGSVARYGGDEFVVVLPGVGFDDAELFGDAALAVVDEPFAFGPAQIPVGMSIGVASAMTPTSEIALVRAADQAAYLAKRSGKNAVSSVDLDARSTPRRVDLDHAR